MCEEPSLWGEFEFTCLYFDLTITDLENITRCITRMNFFIELESSFATGKTLNKLGKHSLIQLDDFLDYINKDDTQEVRLGIVGDLFDIRCDFELIFDLQYAVLCLTISENYLWGYGSKSEPASIKRLKQLVYLCEQICNVKRPQFAELDCENFGFECISLKNPKRKKVISKYNPEKIFSTKNIQSLYQFYVFEYENRLYKNSSTPSNFDCKRQFIP